jgi:hypothetical protein
VAILYSVEYVEIRSFDVIPLKVRNWHGIAISADSALSAERLVTSAYGQCTTPFHFPPPRHASLKAVC